LQQQAPIYANHALAFERAFQRPAHLWLTCSGNTMSEARHRDLAKSAQWLEWARKFPLEGYGAAFGSLFGREIGGDAILIF